MTTGLDTRRDVIISAARERVAVDLSSSTGQPVVDYCHELIAWVVTGTNKPAGAPTERVRAAVRAAVNVGLKAAYGDERSSEIDSGITTRRDVL